MLTVVGGDDSAGELEEKRLVYGPDAFIYRCAFLPCSDWSIYFSRVVEVHDGICSSDGHSAVAVALLWC